MTFPEPYEFRRGISEALFGPLLDRLLAVHDVQAIDAYYKPPGDGKLWVGAPADAPMARQQLWMVTDIGMFLCVFASGGDGEMPSVRASVTAWRDVRDIEMDSDLAAMSTEGVDRLNPLAFSYSVSLTCQLPRLSVRVTGISPAEALAAFGAAALRRYR